MIKLIDSNGTGQKIIENFKNFDYSFESKEKLGESDFYDFKWTFGNQCGTIVIQLKSDGTIHPNSTMNCKDFDRPLGANNDPTLYDIFRILLDSEDIPHR